MNADIYNDSDLWSSTITEQLLDRLVVEGNSAFCLFFLLSLLKSKSAELLSITEPSVLADCMLNCPWSVLEKDMPALLRDASTFMNETPTSTVYALYGLLSQCSSGLLPVAVQGSPELWNIRMTEFYSFLCIAKIIRRCFNPSKLGRIPSLLEQWEGKEDVFEKACLKNYGVDRVLSRDIYYPAYATMAREVSGGWGSE